MATPLPPSTISETDYPSANTPANYEPSEDEQKTIRLVEKLFSEGKKAKDSSDRKWLEYYKFFRGKQWPERRPSYRNSEVLNYIFSEVQNVLVLLTDNRPNIDVQPEDPSDLEFAEILNHILKSKWDQNAWSAVVAEAIVDASIYGTAVGWVDWKPELLHGLGDFVFETEDPFYVFPDPNARSHFNDEYCDWVIRARPTPVRRLKAKYPEYAAFLKADLADLASSYEDRQGLDEVRYKSPTDNRVRIDSDKAVRSGRPDQVLEITCYLKSDELTEEVIGQIEDPEFGQPVDQYQTRLKYPDGRKIVVANGVLLENGENPYRDGKFPCARLVDHALPREFWGVGEVEPMKSPQMIVNKLASYILDVLQIMGNPIWKVTTNAQVDTDNLTNQPGLVVEYSDKGRIEREQGVAIQPGVLQMLEYMTGNVLKALGSTADVSKGVAPSENSSGYAIAQLQEAAQTRIRGKSRNVEYFLEEVGDLMVDRILDGYTIPRVVRLTNNQNAAQYFKFSVSDVDDESGEYQKIAEVQQFQQSPTGEYLPQNPQYLPLKSKLDVKIGVSSALPFAKIEKYAKAEKLYTMGIIDVEEFLTQIDYPNKEKIIERLKQLGAPMYFGGKGNGNGTNGPPTAPPAGPGAAAA